MATTRRRSESGARSATNPRRPRRQCGGSSAIVVWPGISSAGHIRSAPSLPLLRRLSRAVIQLDARYARHGRGNGRRPHPSGIPGIARASWSSGSGISRRRKIRTPCWIFSVRCVRNDTGRAAWRHWFPAPETIGSRTCRSGCARLPDSAGNNDRPRSARPAEAMGDGGDLRRARAFSSLDSSDTARMGIAVPALMIVGLAGFSVAWLVGVIAQFAGFRCPAAGEPGCVCDVARRRHDEPEDAFLPILRHRTG